MSLLLNYHIFNELTAYYKKIRGLVYRYVVGASPVGACELILAEGRGVVVACGTPEVGDEGEEQCCPCIPFNKAQGRSATSWSFADFQGPILRSW
jgi:hypothetical protein